jgi:hypothetical protein
MGPYVNRETIITGFVFYKVHIAEVESNHQKMDFNPQSQPCLHLCVSLCINQAIYLYSF